MKSAILLFLAVTVIATSMAQELKANWSEMLVYDNAKDGFFSEFMGYNDKYIYAKFNRLALTDRKSNSKVKFIAFDKATMKKVAEVPVVGFKENEKSQKDYKDLHYHKTLVFERIIYVFWIKENKEKDELFVQSFDNNLKPLKSLKKIYELTTVKGAAKKAELFIMGNKNVGEQLIIGGELSGQKGENVKIEYKVLNADFSFSNANQVRLPLIITGKSDALSSTYLFGDDGNLHVKTYVTMDKEDAKNVDKHEYTRYPVLTIVKLESGEVRSFNIKYDGKNIFNFGYEVNKESIKVFGFFCDLKKDPKGNDTHGIFYTLIESKSIEVSDANFSYFTKEQLDKLFVKDNQDRKDKKLFKSKKKAKSEEESIASNYEIEDIQSIDNDNLVLFCSRMYNYSTTTCDSKGNCTTRYYCRKDNVTAFKVNKTGNIVWASNIDRRITYSGWNVYDVSVMNKDGKFIIAYGSQYAAKAEKKNFKSKKSNEHLKDIFEYAVIDFQTGAYNKQEYRVNDLNAKKKERKTISAKSIQVIDNQFYVDSKVITYKPTAIFACLCCGPMFIQNFKRGRGYLGNMSVIK